LKDIKSQLIDKSQKAAPAVFEYLDASFFKAAYKQENVAELRMLLGFEGKSMKVSKYSPILYLMCVHQAGSRQGFQTKLFQSEENFKVCDLALIITAIIEHRFSS
jgi:hypothetical protein